MERKTQGSGLVRRSKGLPFWFGGSAAAMATLFTHPFDLGQLLGLPNTTLLTHGIVKVRLQVASSAGQISMVGVATHIISSEGAHGLYTGLSAALLRQATYSTVRFGVYEDLKSRLHLDEAGDTRSSLLLIPLSAVSGVMGGVAGNPADVVNVRMQSDASKPFGDRNNYKHALDGILRIIKSEGAPALFRGVGCNSTRAALMNSSQLATYDLVKRFCLRTLSMPDNPGTHFAASLVAGLVATTVCSPVDVMKTRVMNSTTTEPAWRAMYRTSLTHGPMWMFKGWLPSFIRLGPQTILTMLFLEQHKKLYLKLTS